MTSVGQKHQNTIAKSYTGMSIDYIGMLLFVYGIVPRSLELSFRIGQPKLCKYTAFIIPWTRTGSFLWGKPFDASRDGNDKQKRGKPI